MKHDLDSSHTSDIRLLLRAHGEQRWLTTEVAPVVRQLEQRTIPEEQLGAALAYLEVQWMQARRRAGETDAACAELEAGAATGESVLLEKARRYHAAVRRLRHSLERRVSELLCACSEQELTHEHAGS
jgi:hypothetical protein